MARIVVTGISGRLGRLLGQRLHLDHEVLGLDRRPMVRKPKDIEVFQVDIRRKKCERLFRNRHRMNCSLHVSTNNKTRRT